MKTRFYLLLCALLLSSCANGQSSNSDTTDKTASAVETPSAATNIDVNTAQQTLKESQVVLLDVRTAEEFAQGHIPGAQNIDFLGSNFAEEVKKLDPQQHYVVYCASGNRSQKASQQMTDLGFTQVQNVLGGFQAWQSQNLPVE